MLVRVVTLRFDPRLDGFDEAPLRELCRSAGARRPRRVDAGHGEGDLSAGAGQSSGA